MKKTLHSSILIITLIIPSLKVFPDELPSVSIAPFIDKSEKKTQKFLEELIPKSLFISLIKEYNFRYIPSPPKNSRVFKELFPFGIKLKDLKSINQLREKIGADYLLIGEYSRDRYGNINISVLLLGDTEDGLLIKRINDIGEVGPLLYETIDNISHKIVKILKKHLPEKSEYEKRIIVERLKKIKKDEKFDKIYKILEKEIAPPIRKTYHHLYILAGYPMFIGGADFPNYIKENELMPFYELKGVIGGTITYNTNLLIKALKITNLFLNAKASFFFFKGDIPYKDSSYTIKVNGYSIDIGLGIGYKFISTKTLNISLIIGGGGNIENFYTQEKGTFLKGTWAYGYIDIPVEYKIRNQLRLIFIPNTFIYYATEKDFVIGFSANIGVGIEL